MYVRALTIERLRTFARATLDPNVPGDRDRSASPMGYLPNVTLLLGDNGAGKTTVLRALALAALAPMIPGSGYAAFSMVRRATGDQGRSGAARAELALHREDGGAKNVRSALELVATEGPSDRIEASRTPAWAGPLWATGTPAFFVVGYGASRRTEAGDGASEVARAKARALRYERVAGLFEEGVALRPLSSWLGAFGAENPGRHKQVVHLLSELLAPHARVVLGNRAEDHVLFELQGARLPFGALSDGYRAYVGWLGDLLFHVCAGVPSGAKLRETRGLVLVDEVDLHLHPDWQRRVIPTVARALPKLQFVFTSHSPLVVGSLHPRNVRVLEVDPTARAAAATSAMRIVTPPVGSYGLSADQILTSAHFGLESPRDEAFSKLLRDTSARARAGDDAAAARLMRLMTLGGTALDEGRGEGAGRARRGRKGARR